MHQSPAKRLKVSSQDWRGGGSSLYSALDGNIYGAGLKQTSEDNADQLHLSFRVQSVFQSFSEGTITQVLRNRRVKLGNNSGIAAFHDGEIQTETPAYSLPDIGELLGGHIQAAAIPNVASIEVYLRIGFVSTHAGINVEALMSLLANFLGAFSPEFSKVPLFLNVEMGQQIMPNCNNIFIQPIFETAQPKVNLQRLSCSMLQVPELLHRLLSVGLETLAFLNMHPSRLLFNLLTANGQLVLPNVKHLRIYNVDQITTPDMTLLASGFPNLENIHWYGYDIRWQAFSGFQRLRHASVHGNQMGCGCVNNQLPSLTFSSPGFCFGSYEITSLLSNPYLRSLRLDVSEEDLVAVMENRSNILLQTLNSLDVRVTLKPPIPMWEYFPGNVRAAGVTRLHNRGLLRMVLASPQRALKACGDLVNSLPSVNRFAMCISDQEIVYQTLNFNSIMQSIPQSVQIFKMEFITAPEDRETGLADNEIEEFIAELLFATAQAAPHLKEIFFSIHWSRLAGMSEHFLRNVSGWLFNHQWLAQTLHDHVFIEAMDISANHWTSNRPTRYFANQTIEYAHFDIRIDFTNFRYMQRQKMVIAIDLKEYRRPGGLELGISSD